MEYNKKMLWVFDRAWHLVRDRKSFFFFSFFLNAIYLFPLGIVKYKFTFWQYIPMINKVS